MSYTQLYNSDKNPIYPITDSEGVLYSDSTVKAAIDSVKNNVTNLLSDISSIDLSITRINAEINNIKQNSGGGNSGDNSGNTTVIYGDYYTLFFDTALIVIQDDGTITPNKITPKFKHISSIGNTILNSVPSGYTLKYKKNNGTLVNYTSGDITIDYSDSNLLFELYNNSTKVDSISIPVVSNLENPLLLNLHNLMLGVLCDTEGNLINENLTLSTTFDVYYGNNKTTSYTPELYYDSRYCNVLISGNTLQISNIKNGKDDIECGLEITYTKNNLTFKRRQYITLVRLLGYSTTYDLLPSSNVIKNNTNIEINLKEITLSGSKLLSYDSWRNKDGLTVLYAINGSSTYTNYNGSIDTSNITSGLDIQLKYQNTLIDLQYLPLVKDGITPKAYFLSFLFCRHNVKPDAPTGGNYESPVPKCDVKVDGKIVSSKTWSDSIPSDLTGVVWMSYCVFESGSNTNTWSNPKNMSDSSGMEVIYSAGIKYYNGVVDKEEIPTGFIRNGMIISSEWLQAANNNYWYDDPELVMLGIQTEKNGTIISLPSEPIWMATNVFEGNSWKGWKVTKIKGEDGLDGTSIKVKGSVENRQQLEDILQPQESDSYIVKTYTINENTTVENHLFVYDGDSWLDCGLFKGDAGVSLYIHIIYANKGEESDDNTFTVSVNGSETLLKLTDLNGEAVGDYLGINISNNSSPDKTSDALTNDYKWSYLKGNDGFGYEWIFCLTEKYEAPDVPTSDNLSNWTDDAMDVSEDLPYRWKVYRRKEGDAWSTWKGTSNNKALLDGSYGHLGYTVLYSNQHMLIACNSDGSIKNSLETLSTTVEVMKGTEKITLHDITDNEASNNLFELEKSKDEKLYTLTINKDYLNNTITNINGTIYITENIYVPLHISVSKILQGENSCYVDLTNEFDSVGITPEGKTDADYIINTEVHLYNGSGEIAIDGCTIDNNGLFNVNSNNYIDENTKKGKTLLFKISKNTEIDNKTNINITVSNNALNISKTVVLSIASVKSGDAAVLYKLVLSNNTITLDVNNGTIYPQNIKLEAYLSVNGNITELTDSNTYNIRCYKDNNVLDFNYLNGLINTSGVSNAITVELLVNNKVVDKETIPVIKSGADGQPGAPGNTGAMIIPYGNWKAGSNNGIILIDGVGYDLIYDSNKLVIGRPAVYHLGNYYVLLKDITKEENSESNLKNEEFWKPFEKFLYIFTEAIMADWANLGSAIFYKDYMFSKQGLTDEGIKNYTQYSDKMFENSKLTGQFTPNLFIDYNEGSIKLNQFINSYKVIEPNKNTDIIQLNSIEPFNIKIKARGSTNGVSISDSICVVFPDNIPDYKDGLTANIIYEPENDDINSKYAYALLCVDPNLMDGDKDLDKPCYFIHSGNKYKFILLHPGSKLNMKLFKSGDSIYWFIDNESDFVKVYALLQTNNFSEKVFQNLGDSNKQNLIYKCEFLGTKLISYNTYLSNHNDLGSSYNSPQIFINLSTDSGDFPCEIQCNGYDGFYNTEPIVIYNSSFNYFKNNSGTYRPAFLGLILKTYEGSNVFKTWIGINLERSQSSWQLISGN